MKRSAVGSAFTLIELLVVIGIIAIAAGALGLALRDTSVGPALQSAQSTVASMLAAARSSAALNNTQAALLIYATRDDSGRYLRAFTVATRDTEGDGWTRVSDFTLLPTGIYFVPNGVTVGNGGSTDISAAALTIDQVDYWPITYSALGTLQTGSMKIVLAPGVATGGGTTPTFANAANVRGVLVSTYGAVTFLNDESEFPSL